MAVAVTRIGAVGILQEITPSPKKKEKKEMKNGLKWKMDELEIRKKLDSTSQ